MGRTGLGIKISFSIYEESPLPCLLKYHKQKQNSINPFRCQFVQYVHFESDSVCLHLAYDISLRSYACEQIVDNDFLKSFTDMRRASV